MNKVSILVPVYNVEMYLDECLPSLVGQTLKAIEIFCVNDGSKDSSGEILDAYARQDARVKAIHQRNGGVSAARNRCLRNVRTPFIMWCDPDDFYAPTMCEKMLGAIESSNADVATCDTHVLYETDEYLKEGDEAYFTHEVHGLHPITDDLILSTTVLLWNKIWRTDFVKAYELAFPDGIKYEDAYFYYAYMSYAKTIYFLNEKLCTYRRRVGSIMNETFNKVKDGSEDHLLIIFRTYDYFVAHDRFPEKNEFFVKLFMQGIRITLDHAQTLKHRRRAYRTGIDFARQIHSEGVRFPFQDLRQLAEFKWPYDRKKRWWDIFWLEKVKPSRKSVFVLKFPVYTAKYTETKTTHCILGVPVWVTKPFSFD